MTCVLGEAYMWMWRTCLEMGLPCLGIPMCVPTMDAACIYISCVLQEEGRREDASGLRTSATVLGERCMYDCKKKFSRLSSSSTYVWMCVALLGDFVIITIGKLVLVGFR